MRTRYTVSFNRRMGLGRYYTLHAIIVYSAIRVCFVDGEWCHSRV